MACDEHTDLLCGEDVNHEDVCTTFRIVVRDGIYCLPIVIASTMPCDSHIGNDCSILQKTFVSLHPYASGRGHNSAM